MAESRRCSYATPGSRNLVQDTWHLGAHAEPMSPMSGSNAVSVAGPRMIPHSFIQ